MQQSEFSMEQDDAGMVNDILKELSQEDNIQVNTQAPMPMIQQQMPQQGMLPMPEPLGQNMVHPDAAILNQSVNPVERVTITETASNPWWKVVLNKLKKPITLTVLIFLLFITFWSFTN
jgi:hypothetical protein